MKTTKNDLSISNIFFKLTAIILMLIFMSGCKKKQKKIFLIPKGYIGWVNIVYTDKAEKQQPFEFEDGYVYILTGDLSDFRIRYDNSLDNWYSVEYYYYDKTQIVKIDNDKILFNTTIGSPGSNGIKTVLSCFSFYLSDGKLMEKDPPNPIYKKYGIEK